MDPRTLAKVVAQRFIRARGSLGLLRRPRLWADMGMSAKREAAIKDVGAAFAAVALSWDAAQELVHAFPQRGVLDSYVEGQDDEGEAPGGQPSTDAEYSSLDESVEAERDIEAGCVGGDAVALSKEQAIQVGDVTERLRHLMPFNGGRW